MVVVLGIESTAHTFGVGIASDEGEIYANENAVYTPLPGRGIHPREAAEHHVRYACAVVKRALERAHIKLSDVDAIAVALGPGLGPCLRVGATVARALALRYNKPLVPVHHGIAHIEVARLVSGAVDPLVVLISGGHTMILAYSHGRYRVFGETLDITIGNCFDMFAREAGLPMPGTPHVEELARRGGRYLDMPYCVKGQELSFSGLYTKAVEYLRKGYRLEDICFSLVETAYYMLAEVIERTIAATKKKEIIVTGGVARSRRLREIVNVIAQDFGVSAYFVSDEYAGDNGAMIAFTGALAYSHGVTIDVSKSYVRQRWRVDEVEVPWVERIMRGEVKLKFKRMY